MYTPSCHYMKNKQTWLQGILLLLLSLLDHSNISISTILATLSLLFNFHYAVRADRFSFQLVLRPIDFSCSKTSPVTRPRGPFPFPWHFQRLFWTHTRTWKNHEHRVIGSSDKTVPMGLGEGVLCACVVCTCNLQIVWEACYYVYKVWS